MDTKKKNKKKNVTFSMYKDFLEQFEIYVEKNSLMKSSYVQKLIEKDMKDKGWVMKEVNKIE